MSSLLTILATSGLQSLRDRRAREWALQDRQADRSRNVLTRRLGEAEQYANIQFATAARLLDVELSLTYGVDIVEVARKLTELGPLMESSTRYSQVS